MYVEVQNVRRGSECTRESEHTLLYALKNIININLLYHGSRIILIMDV
jgi:hypothetical protein